VKLFGQGELNRLILNALRKSEGWPMSTAEIVAEIVAELGHGPDTANGMQRRVHTNLRCLVTDRKLVTKHGERFDAKWSLIG
jgi:hypothetical protein